MEEDFRKMEIFSVVNLNDVYRRILFSDFFLIIYLIFLKNIFKKSLLPIRTFCCVCASTYADGRGRKQGSVFLNFFENCPLRISKIKNKKIKIIFSWNSDPLSDGSRFRINVMTYEHTVRASVCTNTADCILY